MIPSRVCCQLRQDFKELFKTSMSRVSSPAMVLTAGCKGQNDILHGMTLSSVCSLSVYPSPLLQFNLHLPSYTSTSLHQNGLLCLHLMPPTAKSVFLSRTFASGIKRDPEHFDVKPDDGELFHEMTTPFSHIQQLDYSLHKVGTGYVPVLEELEAAFICKKKTVVGVDNHEIWVVEVLDILAPNRNYHHKKSGGLLYFDKGFHKVGDNLHE